jgi:hypothetical protein
MTHRSLSLISDDIVTDRRRVRVMKLLEGQGVRVQDSARVYPLCAQCAAAIVVRGVLTPRMTGGQS